MVNSGELDTLCGIKVVTSPYIPDVPVIELSKDIDVSPEFRARCNQWYLEMFGTYKPAYFIGGNLVIHPESYGLLKMRNEYYG